MTRVDIGDVPALRGAVGEYLANFPGDLICARQLWYEGLGGQGTANSEEVAAIEAALDTFAGWSPAGGVRYEKFGVQNSYKRAKGGA